jgi:NADPH-dependent glutamate synthase beta subunit-like oxidoreductase/NAD(P)H-flavin reductase
MAAGGISEINAKRSFFEWCFSGKVQTVPTARQKEAKMDFPLGISGFQFSDLYNPDRLKELHSEFWRFATATSPDLQSRFDSLGQPTLTKPQESLILIDTASLVGDFIAKLFNISTHSARLKNNAVSLHPVFRFKRDFLNIRVFKRFSETPVGEGEFKLLDDEKRKILSHEPPSSQTDDEIILSELVCFLVDCEKKLKTGPLEIIDHQRIQNLCSHYHSSNPLEKVQAALKAIEDWCVQVYVEPGRRKNYLKNWISFIRPNKLDFEHLVEVRKPNAALPELMTGPEEHLRPRDGFKLTDSRMTPKEFMREVDYCIYCHLREKDSCRHGFPEKSGEYKKNPLGIPLKGCPLDERISEMHFLQKQGETIAALAMIMLDNPMCPGTGHRICNDCMKGCIFQKQDPVNIPQNETGILTEALNLPLGFEIYSLLTRFNPINKQRPYALPYNGNDVLVVGLGPAGYTLCHYLANEGFGVVGIDGLKLEPVDATLTGRGRAMPKPIQVFSELNKELDERIQLGFGGVSEYGITVRWDKNFLSLIYLTLLRRKNLRFYGGIRFGGTLTLDDAWELGFKHVAIATGAGRPTIIDMKNNLIRGIRKASDFLMALQLTGAFKKSALANLQVRLPAIVIGGGLTAVDTATELLAYYPVQVEKALERFEVLVREYGEQTAWGLCDTEEKETLATFVEHGKAVRNERRLAEKEKRKPNFTPLCRQWGGVSLVYRKRMTDSPAYRLNHEEVAKALEEGISFIENLSPTEAVRDQYGAVKALKFVRSNREEVEIAAKTVCVAAGTSPNTIYEKEFPGTFKLDSRKQYFKKHRIAKDSQGKLGLIEVDPTDTGAGRGAFFLSYEKDGKFVSFYGDNHPDYAGNVVKAMASAKHGYLEVANLFGDDIKNAQNAPNNLTPYETLVAGLDDTLVPRVVKVVRLAPTIVEVIVKGKYVAQKFEPGQFYRLQNYDTSAHTIDGNRLTMEGLALTGAWVDKENEILSMIVLEMGTSSRLCALLKPGEPVVVMGPTGTPSEIPAGQTVLLVGGGLGNAVLLSVSKALRQKGSRVLYFAGYRRKEDLFKQTEIEEATDQVVWSVDGGEPIATQRPQDLSFTGNILQAMEAYGRGKLQSPPAIRFDSVDHILAIGSDRMMEAVSRARHGVLKDLLKKDHVGIASINSPMQCMMKEVCAQCLQKHVDPLTGIETMVFSCSNQDQPMDHVDFANLKERLKMNNLAERLMDKYLDHLLQKGKVERV